MCTLGFQGKGYSPSFIKNYQRIVDRLKADPETPIQVTPGLDHICSACPHQTAQQQCTKQVLIDRLDQAHLNVLGWQPHQVVTWHTAQDTLKHRMTLDRFHQACEGCSWKSLGVCEAALAALQKESLKSLDSSGRISL